MRSWGHILGHIFTLRSPRSAGGVSEELEPLSILDPFGRLARFQQSTEALLKSRFWAVGLACLLLFCIAPASALAGSIVGKVTAVGGAPIPHARACARKSGGGG